MIKLQIEQEGEMENKSETLRQILHNLDWSDILFKAINHRKTSWKPDPVVEWRNASDEICMAVINSLEDQQILEDMYTKVERLRREAEEKRSQKTGSEEKNGN